MSIEVEQKICDFCKLPIEIANPLETREGKFVHRKCWISYITKPFKELKV